MERFEPVIGLEVHVQLLTRTKAFCRCTIREARSPNSATCPVCLGLPGALPVLNRGAVDLALRLALALKCRVNPVSEFARKHYFYPDLPKGYQITQYERPLAEGGALQIPRSEGSLAIAVRRVHLEEDAGSAQHDPGRGETLVDYNRCGVPLAEVVTEPVIRTPDDAVAYLNELRDTVRFLGICDGNLEAGSFRCDANVSVREQGSSALGNRVELKNLNSFRFVKRGLEYEIGRQTEVLRGGGEVSAETRLFDEKRSMTRVMRGKEQVRDYRYFPEPDLPRLLVDPEWIEQTRSSLPWGPARFRERFLGKFGLSWYDVEVLTAEPDLARYVLGLLERTQDPRQAAHWVMTEVLGVLNEKGWGMSQFPVPVGELAELLNRLHQGRISSTVAKRSFHRMWSEVVGLGQVLEGVEEGLLDEEQVSGLCRGLLQSHPGEVARYRAGKRTLLRWFVGMAVGKTGGKADPKRVEETMRLMLEESGS